MNRSNLTDAHTTGRPRKLATAILLAAMFLVPILPMGDATLTSSSFNAEVVSGSNTLSSDAHYNFTFKTTGGNDRAFRVDFPSAWTSTTKGGTAAGAAPGDNNFPGGIATDDSDQAGFVNFTATNNFVSGTEYYVNVTGIDPPRAAGTYTLTATIFNSTGAANGTATDTVTVSATALTIDLDSDHDDGGSDDMIFGSGAVTDYWFEVTWRSGYSTADSVNITFDDDFDLSDASVTNGEIDDEEAGYDIQTTDDDGGADSTFIIRVRDVENPTVTEETDYTFTAQLRDADGDVIATGTISVTIELPGIVVKSTGGDTTIKEGGATDNITVELETEPAEDVVVTIDPGDQMTVDKSTLTFTASNWDDAQTVEVTAVDDNAVEGTDLYKISFLSDSDDEHNDGLTASHTVEVEDNDDGIVLRQSGDHTKVTEGDTSGDTYQVLLATRPGKTVTVTIDPHDDLDVDDESLTFTASNWDDLQTITVKSARSDDDAFQKRVDRTITHTSESDDDDYDALEAELTVILVDDEHPALGLTDDQIARANALVKLTVTEEDDGILLDWTLPDQDDLDDIFDLEGEDKGIKVHGVQVLASNSPYTVVETFDDGEQEFEDAEYTHSFDDGATPRTQYLVTMFFDEDVGKFTDDTAPDTTDEDYQGTSAAEPLLPWWVWVIIAVVAVILVLLILLAVLSSKNRRAYDDDEVDWDDEAESDAVAATEGGKEKKEKKAAKGKAHSHDLECPVCDHQFTAKGKKPLKTECPNCGAKGVLN